MRRFLLLTFLSAVASVSTTAAGLSRFEIRSTGDSDVYRVCSNGRFFKIKAIARSYKNSEGWVDYWDFSRRGGDISVGHIDREKYELLVKEIRNQILPHYATRELAANRYSNAATVTVRDEVAELKAVGTKDLFGIEVDERPRPGRLKRLLRRIERLYKESGSRVYEYTVANCDGGKGGDFEFFTPLDTPGRWRAFEQSGFGAHTRGIQFEASLGMRHESGYCEWLCGFSLALAYGNSLRGPKLTYLEAQAKTLSPVHLGFGVGQAIRTQDGSGGTVGTVFLGHERSFIDHSWQSLSLYHRTVWNGQGGVAARHTGVMYKFPMTFGAVILGIGILGGPG